VFRFFNIQTGCHFFTAGETERAKLINNFPGVWIFEGIAWFAYPP
jgi:hypothetical protein